MIAAKFFDDHYYDNRHYSQVGGVPKEEMNLLELEFLFLLEFNLYVDPKEYDNFRTVLYRRIGLTNATSDPYNNGSTLGPSQQQVETQPPVRPSAVANGAPIVKQQHQWSAATSSSRRGGGKQVS